MRGQRIAVCLLVAVVACISASCATGKLVGEKIEHVAKGGSVDSSGLNDAFKNDTRTMETNLEQLRRKFAQAVTQLRGNVSRYWGQHDTRVAERTVYVKYTQGYRSRVITDFDHGVVSIETLDEKDPTGSLRSAIIAALLTSNDPSTVDLFSDKDVVLEPSRQPYLYGLVHDEHGHSIRTRRQAEQFADYLLTQKVHTRTLKDEGGKTAHYVRLSMVHNYETKSAERYRPSVEKYASEYHVSPSLVFAIIRTESNFNPFAVSGAPAYGLMQLVPTSGGRAAYRRVQGVDEAPNADYLFDPEHNIELGTAYLGILSNEEFRAVSDASSRDYCVIAAYNTGPRNVTRTFSADHNAAIQDINGMPPEALYQRLRTDLPFQETRDYVVKVSTHRREFASPASPVPAIAIDAALH